MGFDVAEFGKVRDLLRLVVGRLRVRVNRPACVARRQAAFQVAQDVVHAGGADHRRPEGEDGQFVVGGRLAGGGCGDAHRV